MLYHEQELNVFRFVVLMRETGFHETMNHQGTAHGPFLTVERHKLPLEHD